MNYHFSIVLDGGRVDTRPSLSKILSDLHLQEQYEYCKKYADITCKWCHGEGGNVQHDPHQTLYEPCDCVIQNPLLSDDTNF